MDSGSSLLDIELEKDLIDSSHLAAHPQTLALCRGSIDWKDVTDVFLGSDPPPCIVTVPLFSLDDGMAAIDASFTHYLQTLTRRLDNEPQNGQGHGAHQRSKCEGAL